MSGSASPRAVAGESAAGRLARPRPPRARQPARRTAAGPVSGRDIADQSTILAGLADIDLRRLSAQELLLPLRTLQLSLIRQGAPEPEPLGPLRDRIDGLFPHDSFPVNWLLAELLVYWDAPLAAQRTLELLQRAPTQEEQIQYAKTLVARAAELSEPLRLQLLQWLVQSRGLPGGRLVAATLANIRQDIEQVLTGDQRQRFSELLAELDQPPGRRFNDIAVEPPAPRQAVDDGRSAGGCVGDRASDSQSADRPGSCWPRPPA